MTTVERPLGGLASGLETLLWANQLYPKFQFGGKEIFSINFTLTTLGGVYLLMKDYNKALTFHKLDLEIAQRNNNRPCQGRAYGNIAATYEAMGDFSSAIPSQEQHLFIAKEQNDGEAKLIALHGIGR